MTQDQLCKDCARVLHLNYNTRDSTRIEYNRIDQHPDFPTLKATALSGCPSCGVIRHGIQRRLEELDVCNLPQFATWDRIVSIETFIVALENDVFNDPLPQEENGPFRFSVRFSARDLLEHDKYLVPQKLIVFDDNTAGRPGFGKIRRRTPKANPLCPQNLDMISNLIRDCVCNHPDCRLGDSGRSLPTRLIDVNVEDMHEDVRLVDTVNLPLQTPYAAFSHVWGDVKLGPFMTTERATIEQRRKRIPFSELPQNFKDAVTVTRKLGLDYVWIDSLAIIQDSVSDWLFESKRMDQVYANAHVTIVATKSNSAHHGFLARSEPLHPPAKIPYFPPDTDTADGFFYLWPKYLHFAVSDQEANVESSIWNSRGWTFQERLLSQRLLHFTKDMLYFECHTGDWMEDNKPQKSSVNHMNWLGVDGSDARQNLWIKAGGDPTDRAFFIDGVYASWYDLVEQYTTRRLTKSSDKLPAISGLARAMETIVQDSLSFGLWNNDMERSLLWNTIDWGGSKMAGFSRAPSWSWAHWDGDITYAYRSVAYDEEMVDCGFQVLALEDRRSSTDASQIQCVLHLKGKAKGVQSIKRNASTNDYDLYTHTVADEGGKIATGHLDDVHASLHRPGLFALEVQHRRERRREETYDKVRCLLLESFGDLPDYYKRIGAMTIHSKDRLAFFGDIGDSRISIV